MEGNVRLDVCPELGRVVCATRPFAAGDVVLAEPPLLVWQPTSSDPEGRLALLAGFRAASPDVQARVLDMVHPPLDSTDKRVVHQRSEAARLCASAPELAGFDRALAHKLLLISDTNCHAYIGADVQKKKEVVGQVVNPCALFDVGSKVAHSCRPTTLYSSKHGDGKLRYIAVRAIEPGELITFRSGRALQAPRVFLPALALLFPVATGA
jgi:hypothetical protein